MSLKLQRKNDERGISIIGLLILGIFIVFILSHYKISIREVMESPEAKENIAYVRTGLENLWNNYFKDYFTYFWNDVFLEVLKMDKKQ